jgi:hypothetical protein
MSCNWQAAPAKSGRSGYESYGEPVQAKASDFIIFAKMQLLLAFICNYGKDCRINHFSPCRNYLSQQMHAKYLIIIAIGLAPCTGRGQSLFSEDFNQAATADAWFQGIPTVGEKKTPTYEWVFDQLRADLHYLADSGGRFAILQSPQSFTFTQAMDISLDVGLVGNAGADAVVLLQGEGSPDPLVEIHLANNRPDAFQTISLFTPVGCGGPQLATVGGIDSQSGQPTALSPQALNHLILAWDPSTSTIQLSYDSFGGRASLGTFCLQGVNPSDSFSVVLGGSLASGSDSVRFDNVSLTAIPEPSAALLGGFAGIWLLMVRRRRR